LADEERGDTAGADGGELFVIEVEGDGVAGDAGALDGGVGGKADGVGGACAGEGEIGDVVGAWDGTACPVGAEVEIAAAGIGPVDGVGSTVGSEEGGGTGGEKEY